MTTWRCPPDYTEGVIAIGRPTVNTQVYLLNTDGQPVPLGAVGELYIGGIGVARGYLNRPDLTAERFLADPFSDKPDARLYRTGDLARYLPDGNLEFRLPTVNWIVMRYQLQAMKRLPGRSMKRHKEKWKPYWWLFGVNYWRLSR
ncbi:AMP-binding protein [Photorhabdus laumondii]